VKTPSSLHSLPYANSEYLSSHRLSTHSIGEDSEYLPRTRSGSSMVPYPNPPYPHTMQIPPQPFGTFYPPAPWVASSLPTSLHPQGYSSQPMSRDPSHQSSNSIGSSRSLPQARDSPPTLSTQAFSSSPASQIMQKPRSRRPSVVETEPSPRLNPFELDPVMTSYQLYNDTHHTPTATPKRITRGRKRGASIPTTLVSSSGSGPKFLSRIWSMRTRSESNRRRGSESARESLDYEAQGEIYQRKSVSESEPPTRPVACEEIARSASGGIRLDNDTVIEFGSPPARTAAAIEEVRRKSPRAKSSSPLAQQPFSPPAQRAASPPSRRESPPAVVGLGIQPRRAS
jgi:hypothetical protein